jgi:hypothetical protein
MKKPGLGPAFFMKNHLPALVAWAPEADFF